MRKLPWSLLGWACCLVAGCSTFDGARLTHTESAAITSLARKKLTDAYPDMDAATTRAIARTPASFRYYCLAGDCYQYFITWNVSSNRFASVYGLGNIKQLDSARVILRSLPLTDGVQDRH